jgi:hypothetical protein
MMLFVVLAIFALLKERPVLAFTLLTASALIKFSTLVLMPLFFFYSFSHQPTLQKRLLYTIDAGIISLSLIINCFAPFWAGPQTFQRSFQQIRQHYHSFSLFLRDFSSSGIPLHQAELIGWALFGVCCLYALRLCSRDFSSLLKSCLIAMFALLALSADYVQPWYLIWPFMLAILIPQTEISLAAFLLAYASILAGLIRQYIDPWEAALHLKTAAIVDSFVYLAFFLLPILFLIVYRFKHIFLAKLPLYLYSEKWQRNERLQ